MGDRRGAIAIESTTWIVFGVAVLAFLFLLGGDVLIPEIQKLLSQFLEVFGPVGWGAKAQASARVMCFAINNVYGNVSTNDNWVPATEITDDCTRRPAAAGMSGLAHDVVGSVTGLAGGGSADPENIKVRCKRGSDYGGGGDQVACQITGFELPQKGNFNNLISGATFVKYIPGLGDPSFVLYYGKWPKLEAQAAWSWWSAFNLVTTVVPIGKIAKGLKIGTKTGMRVIGKGAAWAGNKATLGAAGKSWGAVKWGFRNMEAGARRAATEAAEASARVASNCDSRVCARFQAIDPSSGKGLIKASEYGDRLASQWDMTKQEISDMMARYAMYPYGSATWGYANDKLAGHVAASARFLSEIGERTASAVCRTRCGGFGKVAKLADDQADDTYEVVSGSGEIRFIKQESGRKWADIDNHAVSKSVGEAVDDAYAGVEKLGSKLYRVRVRGLLWMANRNGIRVFDEAGARGMIDNLENANKITSRHADELRAFIDENPNAQLMNIMTKKEAEASLKATSPSDVAGFVEMRKVAYTSNGAARTLEEAMNVRTTDKIAVMTPRWFVLREGAKQIDKIFKRAEDQPECRLGLKKAGSASAENHKVYRMPNCEENPYELRTSANGQPADQHGGSHKPPGVWLQKFRNINPCGSPLIPFGCSIGTAINTRFYAAAPCKSWEKGVGGRYEYLGADNKGIELNVHTEGEANGSTANAVNEIVQVNMPVYEDGYHPNFCWHHPFTNVFQFPVVADALDLIRRLINLIPGVSIGALHEFDLGLSPWPCHGIIGVADITDQVDVVLEGIPGWARGLPVVNEVSGALDTVTNVLGTCGGGGVI